MAAGRIVLPPYFPARNRENQLLGGALLYVYTNETTTKASIYTNEELTTPSSNPVVANSSGQFPAVFAEAGTEGSPVLYSLSVTTATGASPGNPSNFDNYRPSVDWETAAVALAESAAQDADNSASEAQASATEAAASAVSADASATEAQDILTEIENIVADSPDAPSVVNKLNRNGDNVSTFASELRTNIGLGNSATRNVGQVAGTVAAGDDPRFANTVTFATNAEIQAGVIDDMAIAPDQAFIGMPAVFQEIVCDVRPSPTNGNDNGGILAAFDGQQTYNSIRVSSRLRTADILGQPTSGYSYTVEVVPARIWMNNDSGWNQSTSGNDGRTGAPAMRINVSTGTSVQGDTMAYNASGFVRGAKSGATSFLANPAIGLFTGDATAGQNGVYLNVREIACDDAGYDIACIGDVVNFNRTVGTGALNATWIGYRPQSTGTQPIDAFYSASGPSKIGMDLSTASVTQGAITLAADQTIHFDATNVSADKFPDETVVGTTYMKFNGTSEKYEFWVNGTKAFEFGSSGPAGTTRGVETLPLNATTWTITTDDVLYVTNNSTATTVTGIASGLPDGTEFTVHFTDANTTLDSNIVGGFSLNGFLDVNPPTGAVMTFIKTSANILETGRSFGGLVPGFFTFPDGFSTPEVQSGRPHYKLTNTSATTITNFLNGNGSQQITLLATNDNTTIQHNGSTISLVGGVSVVIPSGHSMTLIRDGSLWREINRSFPQTGWGSLNTGTTPSILGQGENITMVYGSTTSITNFLGGSNSRLVRLHFTNNNVTLVNSSSLNLRGGVNVNPNNNNIITLIRDYVGNWIEVSRNF